MKDIEEERNGGGNISSLTRSGSRGADGVPKLSWIVHDFLSACAAVDAHARAKDKSTVAEDSGASEQVEQPSEHPKPVGGSDLEANLSGTAYDKVNT